MKQTKVSNNSNRQSTNLGELVTVLRGVNYKKAMARKEPSKGLVPIVRATNIQGILDYDNLVYVPHKCVSEDQYLKEGDIVIAASSGSKTIVGKAARVEKDWEGGFGAFCFCVRPKDVESSKFISYFMQTKEYRNRVSELSAGVNINNLKALHIEETPINIPDICEQKRIVEEIETQFTRLDAGVAALKRAQANLKRYRAAVLKAACEGKLVPTEAELAKTEGRSHETGEQLLQRILAERRAKWEIENKKKGGKKKYVEPKGPDVSSLPKLPEGWAWANLDQLMLNVTDGDHQPPKQTETGIPFIVIGNIKNSKIDFQDTRHVSNQYYNSIDKYRKPYQGDILYTLVGSYGIAIRINIKKEFCIQRHISIMRPHRLSPTMYLAYIMNSSMVFKQATRTATGTAQKTVPLKALRKFFIPLPPQDEQKRITDEVERQLSVTEELENILSVNEQRSCNLRNAVLQNSFCIEKR